MYDYEFTKENVSYEILRKEINDVFINNNVISTSYGNSTLILSFNNELTIEDQETLYIIVVNHIGGNGKFYQENYHIDYNVSGKKIAEEWYETDNGNDIYSGKAKRIEYTWSSNKLIQEDEFIYCTNGALWNQLSYKYYMNGNNVIKKPI